MIRESKRRRSGGQGGSAVLEFALSFSVIFASFAGMFQWGYTFYAYNILVTQVRAGARYASLKNYDSTTTTPSNDFLTAVQNVVVYGDPNPADDAATCVNGLTTANVSLVVTAGGSGTLTTPTAMTVSITGFTVNSIFSNMVFNGRPSATFQYSGVLTPPTS